MCVEYCMMNGHHDPVNSPHPFYYLREVNPLQEKDFHFCNK